MALEFYDTFTREVSPIGLGVSDSGHTWTVVENSNSAEVDGTRGIISLAANNSTLWARLDDQNEADVDMTVRFSLSELPTGDSLTFQLLSRYTNSSNHNAAVLTINPDGTTSVSFREIVSGVTTNWQSTDAGSFSDNTIFNMHYRVVGTSFRVKVWFGEDSEPANWTMSGTRTTANPSGALGIRTLLGNSNSNSKPFLIYLNSAVFSSVSLGSVVFDSFDRVVASGIGVTDSDHSWSLIGDESNFSVDSNLRMNFTEGLLEVGGYVGNYEPSSVQTEVEVWRSEVARTNLLPNPSIETNTTGWEKHPSTGGTIARSSDWQKYGTYSLQVTTTATTTGTVVRTSSQITTTAGLTYTFSAYGYSATNEEVRLLLYWYDGGGTNVSTTTGTYTAVNDSDGTRISVSGTAPVGSVGCRPAFQVKDDLGGEPDLGAGVVFYFDGMLFEQTDTLKPYFDGSLSGAAWSGTAHASTSTLAAGRAVINDLHADVIARYDGTDLVRATLTFSTDGKVYLNLYEVAGSEENIGDADVEIGSYTTDQHFSVLFEIQSNKVKVKAWQTAGVEPASWTIEGETTLSVPEAGFVGLLMRRAAHSHDGEYGLRFDNLNVRDIAPEIVAELVANLDSPGVRLTLHNGDVYHKVRVERIHVENKIRPAAVRGYDEVDIPSAVASAIDYEMPLDEPIVYRLYALDENNRVIAEAESDLVLIEVPYHRVIVRSVGQPTLSSRVQIVEFPEFSQNLRVLQEAQILGQRRKVILFDVMEGMTGSFSFMTLLGEDPMGDGIRTLINEGQPLMFQSVSRITGIPDFYFVVKSVTHRRKTVLRDNETPRYIFTVEFEEVNRPPTDSESLGFFSWNTLLDVGHDSWASVENTFSSWLSVLNFAGREPLP
jgi:hypothetical protein